MGGTDQKQSLEGRCIRPTEEVDRLPVHLLPFYLPDIANLEMIARMEKALQRRTGYRKYKSFESELVPWR